MLLPRQETFNALSRLNNCLSTSRVSRAAILNSEEESRIVNSPEYALLGGLFNSLFLCPTLLHAQNYFSQLTFEEDEPTDSDTSISLLGD